MNKTYYKIVRCEKDRLFSCSGNITKIEYFFGVWIKPKVENSYLFCFDNYIDANSYFNTRLNDYYRLYECEVKEVKQYYPIKQDIEIKNIIKYWNDKKNKKKNIFNLAKIDGCVCAKEIKLIKQIF